jgi:hypothetical protein
LLVLQAWLGTGPTNLVSLFISLDIMYLSPPSLVKWLGPDAIAALAVDGKGTKAELLGKVAQWVAARGRNVTQPGDRLFPSYSHLIMLMSKIRSDDCVL